MTTEKILQESPKGELLPKATVKKYLTVRQEGNRQVKRELEEGSVIRNFRITATNGKRDLPKPALTEGKAGDDA